MDNRFVLITKTHCCVYEKSLLVDMGGQPKMIAVFEIDDKNQGLTLAEIETIRTANYDDDYTPAP